MDGARGSGDGEPERQDDRSAPDTPGGRREQGAGAGRADPPAPQDTPDAGDAWDGWDGLVLDEAFVRGAEQREPAARTRMLRERWRDGGPEPQPWRADEPPAGWFFSRARRAARGRRRRRGRRGKD